MEYREEKIATFTQRKTRIQLLIMTEWTDNEQLIENGLLYIKYQIRVNRKRVYTTGFEYDARKYFAMAVQNSILQLKIY